jgi:hypothetical protein
VSGKVDVALVRSGGLERVFGPVAWSAFRGDTQRWPLSLRLPETAARLLHPRPRKLMGVNFSVSRAAFFGVNGYDETAPAKREDRELEVRLLRGGYKFAALLNRAIVYHLHHPFAPASAEGERRMLDLEVATHVRSVRGLSELST